MSHRKTTTRGASRSRGVLAIFTMAAAAAAVAVAAGLSGDQPPLPQSAVTPGGHQMDSSVPAGYP